MSSSASPCDDERSRAALHSNQCSHLIFATAVLSCDHKENPQCIGPRMQAHWSSHACSSHISLRMLLRYAVIYERASMCFPQICDVFLLFFTTPCCIGGYELVSPFDHPSGHGIRLPAYQPRSTRFSETARATWVDQHRTPQKRVGPSRRFSPRRGFSVATATVVNSMA